MSDNFKAKSKTHIKTNSGKQYTIYSLDKLQELTGKKMSRLPYSIRILAENLLRNIDGKKVKETDVLKVLNWKASDKNRDEIPFMPARVVMQDFTGVPAVVDLASMRDAVKKAGGDPSKINPLVDTALVIDHSVQVDYFGTAKSLTQNVDLEFQRNKERYSLLKWAQKAFDDFKVVPPGMGIIHQVNLEYLAPVTLTKEIAGEGTVAYPDTLVGTDSHTTMINGLGVLGWGVGGIEAEAVMLGQPYYMELPDVVGVKLTGALREGVTATDLVLYVTEMLRKQGVVGKFVEFFGEGLNNLTLPDRATIANMAPEYGATMGYFPVDKETLRYLDQSNRSQFVDLVEASMKAQHLFREDSAEEPEYSTVLTLDLSTVDSTLAGPKRPQDRVSLRDLKTGFHQSLTLPVEKRGFSVAEQDLGKRVKIKGMGSEIGHGAVAIAAITSCTNTSNPYVMIGAGLLARNAVKKGLTVKPYVKTSLAPGSQVVTEYLQKADLLQYLEALHFNVVGYGCTTCIGNSGPLDEPVVEAIKEGDLVVAAVLSGNRNFEGRINPHVKANYLASPVHVVAFALAGTVDFDPELDPIANDAKGNPVYLKDIWPSTKEIHEIVETLVTADMYRDKYATVFEGTEFWKALDAPTGNLYNWDQDSTYIQCPPFFDNLNAAKAHADIVDARMLGMFGDSITTDHISPAGSIKAEYPAGQYLIEHGVGKEDFNSYGARRGNHEVMMRGTFGNVRLHNLLTPGKEGSFTLYQPSKEVMYIYDASMKYQENGTPLVIVAGKEYGTGSSRDWAAKGTYLLGVKVVIAESYERIHRSNLVGMGVLPLQFLDGQGRESLNLDGSEVFTIRGLSKLIPRQEIEVTARSDSGELKTFKALVRLDNEIEVDYYNNGGILQTVLKNLM
ncbi:MAG: aconitate hydratase 1 [Gammaproteobacteria bacterium]|jgi:aconitate hydratase|nr:aconitate hydratase 1 [Gammaproteobacteria bacterium]